MPKGLEGLLWEFKVLLILPLLRCLAKMVIFEKQQ